MWEGGNCTRGRGARVGFRWRGVLLGVLVRWWWWWEGGKDDFVDWFVCLKVVLLMILDFLGLCLLLKFIVGVLARLLLVAARCICRCRLV